MKLSEGLTSPLNAHERLDARWRRRGWVCLLGGWLTSQQHASVSQGRICSDKFTCCHTETEVADQTFVSPSPSSDPITSGAWQGSHWSASFYVTVMTRPRKIPSQADSNPGSFAPEADALTTRPARWYRGRAREERQDTKR